MILLALHYIGIGYSCFIRIETRAFTDFLTTEKLLFAVQIMLLGIAIIVAAIYASLAYKKRKHLMITSITKNLEIWLTGIIIEDDIENVQLPAKFYRKLKSSAARQIVIDELIRVKKNFSDDVSNNLIALYSQLGLYKDSLKKLRSRNSWYTIARGIQELYQMNQLHYAPKILHQTNSKNEQIRNEAQAGIVSLLGFEGLRFLDILTYPISEWQQMKLLDQLKTKDPDKQVIEKIEKWLRSDNVSVVVFVLRVIGEYKFFSVHDQVANCLLSDNSTVRRQAIKTIGIVFKETTADLLAQHFFTETYDNKLLILDTLPTLSNKRQIDFFKTVLGIDDPTIQLRTALVMFQCCNEADVLLQEYALQQPDPFEKIYRHIKTTG